METYQGLGCKRRRRHDKAALKARLVLHKHDTENVGLISQDLFTELFPEIFRGQNNNPSLNNQSHQHIAIALCESVSTVESAKWTIVPIKLSKSVSSNTLQFSRDSISIQSLFRTLSQTWIGHQKSYIKIVIVDVIPLELSSIFVAIEEDVAREIERGEEISSREQTRSKEKSMNCPDLLWTTIRQALANIDIVHNGDLFPLPPQPNLTTHLPLSPAKVILCEPVEQGILTPFSKIVVTRTRKNNKNTRHKSLISSDPIIRTYVEEDEDTSNDQFYSATEDNSQPGIDSDNNEYYLQTETEATSTDDDLSEDLMSDIICLQVPQLSTIQNLSGNSTLQPVTPKKFEACRKSNVIESPISVVSRLTSTTALGSNSKRCLFKIQALLCPISEEIIYPKPNRSDDDEARVFVDTQSLTKIGCFSGDWVRLEATSHSTTRASFWDIEDNGILVYDDEISRPVKIFGLSESYSNRPNNRVLSKKYEYRKSSFSESQIQKPASPIAYLSPILLANMDNKLYCRISAIKRLQKVGRNLRPKVTSKSRPPTVRDLGLVKISTPFSTERYLQNVLFSGLQRYFSGKTRIVRQGDLVAIGIDGNLAQTMYQPIKIDDIENDEDDFTSAILDPLRLNKPGKPTGVAWFRVNYVGNLREDSDVSKENDNIWGGVVSVDASFTRISQSGSENCRLPQSMTNPWEYYLGLKTLPQDEDRFNLITEYKTPSICTLQRRLQDLITAATSSIAVHLNSRPLAILIYSTQRNIGKTTIAQRAFTNMGLHCLTIDAYDIVNEEGSGSDLKMTARFEVRVERATACGAEFCGLLIKHIELFSADRIISSFSKVLNGLRIVIATTTDIDKVPQRIRSLFTHEMEMTAPDEGERESILRGIVDSQAIPLAPNLDLSSVAMKTAALVAADLVDVLDRALIARIKRLEKLAFDASHTGKKITIRDIIISGGPFAKCINKVDFDVAVEKARKNFADTIGAPKIPSVSWNDVGGLAHVKSTVMETIQLPLERPELFAKGMKKRSGILFYGPPGTGKTLLAKAIATEFSLNFFSVKGPELLNMYIGESEANVRRVFQRARDARPCVVFFDELDSVAPKRGNQGDSGGVMDRIVSQILAELDGMSDGEDGSNGVFVIGATNRPDLLDTALLRPGRFDKMLYLGVSETHEKQLTIMEALTRKFTLHPKFSLENFVERLPFTYTGADLYALCSDAMLKAVTRKSSLVDQKISEINAQNSRSGKNKISTAYFFDHFATNEDLAVTVTEEDFWAAERELISSVSAKELENYNRVRAQFEKFEHEDGFKNQHEDRGKSKEKSCDLNLDKGQDVGDISESKTLIKKAYSNRKVKRGNDTKNEIDHDDKY